MPSLLSIYFAAATAAKSLQLCPTLCDPVDVSPPGSPVPGILQARTHIGVGCHFLLQCMKVKSESEVAQSCLTPSGPMDCSAPGSSVQGIFQARILEWVTIPFCTRLSQPRDLSLLHCRQILYHLSHWGPWGIFLDTSSHRHNQSLTQSPVPLFPSQRMGDELKFPSFES